MEDTPDMPMPQLTYDDCVTLVTAWKIARAGNWPLAKDMIAGLPRITTLAFFEWVTRPLLTDSWLDGLHEKLLGDLSNERKGTDSEGDAA